MTRISFRLIHKLLPIRKTIQSPLTTGCSMPVCRNSTIPFLPCTIWSTLTHTSLQPPLSLISFFSLCVFFLHCRRNPVHIELHIGGSPLEQGDIFHDLTPPKLKVHASKILHHQGEGLTPLTSQRRSCLNHEPYR